MLENNELQAYQTWREGLTERDYYSIYSSLARLDLIEQLLMEGKSNDHIKRVAFGIDHET